MKSFFFILFLATLLSTLAQVTGSYSNSFGSRITLNADSTFKYKWNFDLASSWNTGKWQIMNDTIYLNPVIVYDTLKMNDKKYILRDSLVLSMDEKSETITENEYLSYLLVSGGQSRIAVPTKLLYHQNELFDFTKESKLLKKKVRIFMNSKKVVPWYRKSKNH